MQKINNFLNKYYDSWDIVPISGDASFRKYYRIKINNQTFILMDSNPELEDNNKFLNTREILFNNNIKVPKIYQQDIENGLFILEDFGDILFSHKQNLINLELYKKAIDEIYNLQQIKPKTLAKYDENLLLNELNLCKEWYNQNFDYSDIFSFLIGNIASHKQVLVHRDYHSRNIMIINNSLGIIDFQDMVIGSYVYDLVSLLKDVYIELSTEQQTELLRYFYTKNNLDNWDNFIRDFELMGVQRHLKILGIFSRLNQRDNKPNFIKNIPLTKKYLYRMAEKYPELTRLKEL